MKQLYGYDPLRMGIPVNKWTGKYEALLVCPYHNDHTPSLSLNVISGSFYCFSCGESGGAEKLAKSFGGVCSKTKISARKYDRKEESNWRILLSGSLAFGNKYLLHRGVTNEQIEKFGLIAYKHGIVTPIKNTLGTIIGAVLRHFNRDPKYLYFGEKPGVWWPPGVCLKDSNEDIFVTEGLFGVLAADRAGVKAVSTLGAMVKKSARVELNKFNPFVLFDNDFAGYIGAVRILKLYPLSRVYLPGAEADEMGMDEWKRVYENRYKNSTRNILSISEYVYDKRKFIAKIIKH